MSFTSTQPPPSHIERLLDHDRWLIAASLALLVLLAWTYLVATAAQMGRGEMAAPAIDATSAEEQQPPAAQSAPEMPNMPGMRDMPGMAGANAQNSAAAATMTAPRWSARAFLLTFLMWWVMMIGMMLPSAAPMILLFGRVQRRQLAAESPAPRVAAFTLGYLAVWGAFSVLAATAQSAFTELGLVSAMDLKATRVTGALLVAVAGAYQVTRLKNACLLRCRSPAEFLATHWSPGTAGALRMGAEHGVFCVGCCWLLMGLLFFAGVMNLLWVAALAAFILLEKLLPRGDLLARATGIALLAFAGYQLLLAL